ncbi:hypothetical protein ACIBU0_33545 [Streptomyces sp. NPDC049627]|uniref:hypothetical protein n=1 Tax=Streptomyces sp. NPDC049627 TaxID=3365595 RepID=UPI0037B07FEC
MGRLLFVAVLALGIFAMHTMGHPDESHSSATNDASHASTVDTTAAAAHDPMALTAMTVAAATDAGRSTDGAAAPDHATGPAHSSSTHEPAMAMDMLSLCLAVLLGAWVLAGLLRSAFARHPEWLAKLLAQVAAVLRPNPPPRRPDLTRLSILRL